MIKQYRELFYNFGKKSNDNVCMLCSNNPTDTPIEYHLIIECKRLDELRHRFWNYARHAFAHSGKQINTIHHQLFLQHLIRVCRTINMNKQILWQLICGANSYDNKDELFVFKYNNVEMSDSKYSLLNNLTTKIHEWIHNVYRIHNNEVTIRYLCNKNSIIDSRRLIYHIRNDTYGQWLLYKYKLRDDDILVGTDSSHKHDLTGIGIIIKDRNKIYTYHEPIGPTSNHYGELFAINKAHFLINHFKIDYVGRRVILFTDSLSNFLSIITPPKNEKRLEYPGLHKITTNNIKSMNTVLWKIKSHTNPSQFYNYIADELADRGRINANNSFQIIPNPNDTTHADIQCYESPNGDSHSLSIVPRKFKLRGEARGITTVFDRGW
eukprot:135066_1